MALTSFTTVENDFDKSTPEYFTCFMLAHSCFLLVNVLNLSYLFLFEGFVFERLQKNLPHKIACVSVFLQIVSCFTSIHKFNIMEEFDNIYAAVGGVAGTVSIGLMSIVYLYCASFDRDNRNYFKAGMAFWVISCALAVKASFDPTSFTVFRMFGMLSVTWFIAAKIRILLSYKKGDIHIESSIASHDEMSKILLVCIIVDVAFLLITVLHKLPAIAYTGTGIWYSTMIITASYAGRMDFMMDQDNTPLGGDAGPKYLSVP